MLYFFSRMQCDHVLLFRVLLHSNAFSFHVLQWLVNSWPVPLFTHNASTRRVVLQFDIDFDFDIQVLYRGQLILAGRQSARRESID